jgi:hypothetical protein
MTTPRRRAQGILSDANWSKEFDNQLELAAARKLVELLKARRQGDPVAVGPGTARLHIGLEKIITTTAAERVHPAALRHD